MPEVTDLSGVENAIRQLDNSIATVGGHVDTVDDHVNFVAHQVQSLEQELHDFVYRQSLSNNVSLAEQRIVKVEQKINKQFGHYSEIRRTMRGIVEATDLNIIRKSSIANATDDLFLKTPSYWLAPALVALSAWINDERDLAERALKEAIRRDSKKTELLFALICRRGGRINASRRWTIQYLASQSEAKIDHETMVLIDAYANGVLGIDQKHYISQLIVSWLDNLSKRPGYEQQAINQWKSALGLLPSASQKQYPLLQKYGTNWQQAKQVLDRAYLCDAVTNHFRAIYERPNDSDNVRKQLDDILTHLVTDHDQAEMPLYQEEQYNKLIIKYHGDKKAADKERDTLKQEYQKTVDFGALLTQTAMETDPEKQNVASQKLAVALSKKWIKQAYDDLVAQNRANVLSTLDFSLNGYTNRSVDGSNEQKVVNGYATFMEQRRQNELAQHPDSHTGFIVGAVIALIGLFLIFVHPVLGIVAIAAGGIWAYHQFSQNNAAADLRDRISTRYDNNTKAGQEVIYALMAEIADYRDEFAAEDAKSRELDDFLDQLTPEKYINSLDQVREVKVNA